MRRGPDAGTVAAVMGAYEATRVIARAAEAAGVPYEMARRVVRRSGAPRRPAGRPFTEEDKRRMWELLGQGWSKNQVAFEMDRGIATIVYHSRKRGEDVSQ